MSHRVHKANPPVLANQVMNPADSNSDSVTQASPRNSAHQLTRAGTLELIQQYGNQRVSRMIQRQRGISTIQRWENEADQVCSPDKPVDGNLLAFTELFNEKFRRILHIFESAKKKAPVSCSTDATNPEALEPETLEWLFTKNQRTKIMDFLVNNSIPERLFNGDEVGNATVGQRSLMAAHILAVGTYMPGSFEQRVHARFCGHWAHIVWHYAGITPGGGSGPANKSTGIMGNFDHAGNIVLGSNAAEYEGVYRGDRTKVSELPEVEGGEEGYGPLHGNHAAHAHEKSFREQAAPISILGSLKAGDWLYVYNANRSGTHSVIFSRYVSGPKDVALGSTGKKVTFYEIEVFDQPDKKPGGRMTSINIGTQYYAAESVVPVTNVTRMDENARPAETVEELLPYLILGEDGSKNKKLLAMEKSNLAFLETIAKKNPGMVVNVTNVLSHLQKLNNDLLQTIEHRMTARQKDLMVAANNRTEVEVLVMLNQRLQELAHNVELYQRNMKSEFSENLDEKHKKIHEATQPHIDRIEGELAEMTAQEQDVKAQLDALQSQYEALNVYSRLKALREHRKILQALPKNDPDRVHLLSDNLKQIEDLKTIKNSKENKDALKAIKNELRAVRKQLPNSWKRQKLEKELKKYIREMPYGLVHPGSLNKEALQYKHRKESKTYMPVNGRLDYLFTPDDIKPFLEPRPEGASTTSE